MSNEAYHDQAARPNLSVLCQVCGFPSANIFGVPIPCGCTHPASPLPPSQPAATPDRLGDASDTMLDNLLARMNATELRESLKLRIRERDEARKELAEAETRRQEIEMQNARSIRAALDDLTARVAQVEGERDEATRQRDDAQTFNKTHIDAWHFIADMVGIHRLQPMQMATEMEVLFRDLRAQLSTVTSEAAEARKELAQVMRNAIGALTGHCQANHAESLLSFTAFKDAGGCECAICLKAECQRLREALGQSRKDFARTMALTLGAAYQHAKESSQRISRALNPTKA